MKPLTSFFVLLRSLAASDRRGYFLLLGLALAASVVEGIGLASLAPLLAVLDPSLSSEAGGVVGAVRDGLAALGGPDQRTVILPLLLVSFLLLLGLRAWLIRRRDLAQLDLLHRFTKGLRLDLFKAVGQARWDHLVAQSTADLTESLMVQIRRSHAAAQQMLRLPALLLLILMHLAVAFLLAPWVLVLAIAVAAGLLWGVRVRDAHRQGQRLTRSATQLMRQVTAFLGALKLVKSHGQADRHVHAFAEATDSQFADERRFQSAQIRSRTLFQLGAGTCLVLLVGLAILVLDMPVVELLVVVFVFSRLLPMLIDLQTCVTQIIHGLPAFEAVRSLIQECQGAAEEPGPDPQSAEAVTLNGAIWLEGVTFAYAKHPDRAVLQDLSARIPAGQITALVGPSGAGKSTLADLVLGLMQPTEGRVVVDGLPIAPANRQAWRDVLAYVPQDVTLFDDSVRANLLWGLPETRQQDPTEDDLWAVLSQAQAKGFVERLPDGLDTVIGPRGQQLSGGERQRLALARALLRQPKLLVLDEATSALDPGHERLVQRALEGLRGARTMLVIAHRDSTIRIADHILVLRQGQLVEEGSWQEVSDALGQDLSDWLIADILGGSKQEGSQS
ncbi:MAG: ABC transporter ATP-binding protein [Rhodospirillaceae bacterium]